MWLGKLPSPTTISGLPRVRDLSKVYIPVIRGYRITVLGFPTSHQHVLKAWGGGAGPVLFEAYRLGALVWGFELESLESRFRRVQNTGISAEKPIEENREMEKDTRFGV